MPTRRHDFLQMAQATGAGLYDVDMPDSGMNTIAWLKAGQDDRALAGQAAQVGVHAYPLGEYGAAPLPRPGLLLGFTKVAPHQLGPRLEALAKHLARAG